MAEDSVKRLRTAYQQLKKKNNCSFFPIGVLCVLYVLLRQDWLMYGACLTLLLALAVNKKRTVIHEQAFYKEGTRFSQELAAWISKAVPEGEIFGCGYLRLDRQFYNIFWVISYDMIYLFELPVQAHFVYSVESEFRFIFSITEQTEPIEKLHVDALCFRILEKDHQDFLQEQAIGSQQLLVMQGFMYDQVCMQALAGRLNGSVKMSEEIDRLRKETLFVTRLPSEATFYVTENSMKRIQKSLRF